MIAVSAQTSPSDAALQHVEMLHQLAAPLAGHGKLIVASYGEDPDSGTAISPKVEQFTVGDVAGMAAAVRRLAGERHRNVYTPLAVMRPDLPPRRKGEEADIAAVLGFVVDDDPDRDKGAAALPLAANYALQTSTTPTANRQHFYLLSRPLTAAEAKPIAEALTGWCGADHGGKDLCHVWRVPGCWNWPNRRKVREHGRPREPQPVTVLQPWDGSLTDPEALAAAVRSGGSGTADVAAILAALPPGLRRTITEPTPTGERSEALYFVIRALAERGLTDAVIRAVIEAHPRGIGEKYANRSDLGREIQRVRQSKGGTASAPSDPNDWPEPGRLVRPIPPAPSFPLRSLPAALAGFVADEADRMQAPHDLLAIPALITLAALIGKDATLRPKARDDWSERACLWGMVVQPPGGMKSAALMKATAPLRRIQGAWALEDAGRLEEWQEAKAAADLRLKAWEQECAKRMKGAGGYDAELPPKPKAADNLPHRPRARRILTQDATIEKLADLMAGSRGLSLVRDELAGFLLNMARYAAGSDRQFYLECYSGGSYAVDRIGRGEQQVSDLYLNIVGTIQPSVARQVFAEGGADDGFLDRFGLIAYPDLPSDWQLVDRWPNAEARGAYNNVCDRLAAANWDGLLLSDDFGGKPYARFSPGAQAIFDDWLTGHMRAVAQLEDDPAAGLLAKARGTLCRLALVIHLAAWAGGEEADPARVSERSLARALHLLEDYLAPMWRRVLTAFAKSAEDDGARRIARHILQDRLRTIRKGDVAMKKWSGLKDRPSISAAFEALVDADWLTPPPPGVTGARGGRPSAAFRVNPLVHSKFGDGHV